LGSIIAVQELSNLLEWEDPERGFDFVRLINPQERDCNKGFLIGDKIVALAPVFETSPSRLSLSL